MVIHPADGGGEGDGGGGDGGDGTTPADGGGGSHTLTTSILCCVCQCMYVGVLHRLSQVPQDEGPVVPNMNWWQRTGQYCTNALCHQVYDPPMQQCAKLAPAVQARCGPRLSKQQRRCFFWCGSDAQQKKANQQAAYEAQLNAQKDAKQQKKEDKRRANTTCDQCKKRFESASWHCDNPPSDSKDRQWYDIQSWVNICKRDAQDFYDECLGYCHVKAPKKL